MTGGTGLTLLGFDTETTGVSPVHDRIVTAALVYNNGTDRQLKEWLASPDVPISEQASAVNGITNEYAAANGRPPVEVADEIAETIAQRVRSGCALVIFNALFDLPLLQAELRRNSLKSLEARLAEAQLLVLDPLVLDRTLDRYRRGPRRLENLVQHYGVQVEGNLHNAGTDVDATLAVLESLWSRYPQLAEMSPTELMELQRNGHREWAEHFNEWLAAQGRKPNVALDWPMSFNFDSGLW
ncbi:MAG: exonuclease domain-containing protein [Varibaculum sp.]|nr:exonuclease domain-containing protein [Varibaculum sp.]